MTKKGFSIQKDKLEGLWKAKRAGCVFLRMKMCFSTLRWKPFAAAIGFRRRKGGMQKNAAVTMCHGGVFMSSGGD
jgi:hypothetical protein